MWLPAAAICCSPVAVPGVRLADGAAALHTDRCHSLGSLGSATGGGRLAPQIFTGDLILTNYFEAIFAWCCLSQIIG